MILSVRGTKTKELLKCTHLKGRFTSEGTFELIHLQLKKGMPSTQKANEEKRVQLLTDRLDAPLSTIGLSAVST